MRSWPNIREGTLMCELGRRFRVEKEVDLWVRLKMKINIKELWSIFEECGKVDSSKITCQEIRIFLV